MTTVTADGADIRYEVVGSGPPLVLQHGRFGSGRFWSWAGYTDRLEPERSLILIDARGHGRSTKPHSADQYTSAKMGGDVIAVLDDLDIDRCDYFGYSMGARIGFAALARHPERFNCVIAGGGSPFGPASTPEAELAQAELLAGGMEALVDNMQRRLSDVDRAALMTNDAEALAALATATAKWPDLTDHLAALDTPLLLFGGEADPIRPDIERAAARLPTAEWTCVGPFVHGEDLRHPELIVPLVVDYLGRHGLRR